MPRAPPKGTSSRTHVMGDHSLFYNASTAKRFPMLARVPQKELASMFNVPVVYPEDLKEQEEEFAEPYNDAIYNFRPLDQQVKPFLPACSSQAKAQIAAKIEVPEGDPIKGPQRVYTGGDGGGGANEENNNGGGYATIKRKLEPIPVTRRLMTADDPQRKPPFGFGGAAEAKASVERRVYLNSLDEPSQAKLAQQIQQQIIDNKQAMRSTTGSSSTGKKKSRTTVHSQY